MDRTGFEPVTTGDNSVEVTVTSTGPDPAGKNKTPNDLIRAGLYLVTSLCPWRTQLSKSILDHLITIVNDQLWTTQPAQSIQPALPRFHRTKFHHKQNEAQTTESCPPYAHRQSGTQRPLPIQARFQAQCLGEKLPRQTDQSFCKTFFHAARLFHLHAGRHTRAVRIMLTV